VDKCLKASVDIETQNQQTVTCEVMTDIGQNSEDNIEGSDTEPTDGAVWGTERQWKECRGQ
jgi:hypothetical protein